MEERVIKSKMKTKSKLYKLYIKNVRFESDVVFIERLVTEVNDLTPHTKALPYDNLAIKLNNWKHKHIGQFLKHLITTEKSF